MRKRFFVIISIFLCACSFVPRLSPDPSEKIIFKPSPTPTLVPSPMPTPVPPTVSPVPTIDPLYFRDDFIDILDAQWSWKREKPENWSLTTVPGSLQINAAEGFVATHTNSNLLLRPAPEGNFQIETQMTFRPTHDFVFAGLIIYENDLNFIQAGRGFCHLTGCIGEGLYMYRYKNGAVRKPDFGQPYREIDPILLRLSRRENTYTFEASTDGKVWFLIGSHTSEINPLQIGLIAGQRMRGELLSAAFDYFEIRSLP
jgi:beta-xylosidase